MPEALAVVKVGNSEWLLRRLTPSRAIAAMVGAVVSSTMRERRPSATNSTTLCGCEAGVCANAVVPKIPKTGCRTTSCRIAVPRRSDGRMGLLRAKGGGKGRRLFTPRDDACVTGARRVDNGCDQPGNAGCERRYTPHRIAG